MEREEIYTKHLLCIRHSYGLCIHDFVGSFKFYGGIFIPNVENRHRVTSS